MVFAQNFYFAKMANASIQILSIARYARQSQDDGRGALFTVGRDVLRYSLSDGVPVSG
jgi:hypothetical protein